LLRREGKKAKKDKKEENAEKNKEQLEKEKLIVDLTFRHIKELKKEEGFGVKSTDDDDNLFTDGIEQEDIDKGQTWVTGIPDIDDPQFILLRQNDEIIDKGLEEILDGVRILKGIAVDINGELKIQDPAIEQLNIRVDKTRVTLDTLNTQLAKTLKKVRSAKNCCCDCIMIMCLLGVAVAMIFIITNPNI